ncbi:MAG: winged helix-turn-helix domain-containing protein [Anaeromyxobacter sp.]
MPLVAFGPFRLDPHGRVLYRDGAVVALPLKAAEVLAALVARPGEVLTKDELLAAAWPDVVVEEGTLTRHVSTLRAALGPGPADGGWIETVPKRGYRFAAQVSTLEVAPAPQPAAPPVAGPRRSRLRRAALAAAAFLVLALVAAAVLPRRPGSVVEDPEAARLVARGKEAIAARTRDGFDAAITLLDEAVRRAPGDARAWAALADANNLSVFYGFHAGTIGIVRAREAALRAVEVDPSCADGHAALGYAEFMWFWNWDAAERAFRRAIELTPGHVSAHHWYALMLVAAGRGDDALATIARARALAPDSAIVATAEAWIAWHARRPERAEAASRAVLEAHPDVLPAIEVRGLALEALGRHAEAVEVLRRAVEAQGADASPYLGDLGHALASAGRAAEAGEILARLDELSRRGKPRLYQRALLRTALGDRAGALEDLRAAADLNDPARIWMRSDPRLDGLRDRAEFAALLARLPERAAVASGEPGLSAR